MMLNDSRRAVSSLLAVTAAACASDLGLESAAGHEAPPGAVKDFDTAVYMVDVSGSAILIDHGETEIIIDGGYRHARAGDDRLLNFVRDSGVVDGPVDLIVISHPDTDHYQGIDALFGPMDGQGCRAFLAGEPGSAGGAAALWESGYQNTSARYREFMYELRDMRARGCAGVPEVVTSNAPYPYDNKDAAPREFNHNGLRARLLHENADAQTGRKWSIIRDPIGEGGQEAHRINNSSLVLRIDANGRSALFTGDINGLLTSRELKTGAPPRDVEAELVRSLGLDEASRGLLNVDMLLIPHHADPGSGSRAFVCAAQPEVLLFSHREWPFFHRTFSPMRWTDTHPRSLTMRRLADYACGDWSADDASWFGTRIAPVYCGWNAPDRFGDDGFACGYLKPETDVTG